MLGIIFSAFGSALFEIIKKIVTATFGEENTELEKHLLEVFDKTSSKFFHKYGEMYGKHNETFLTRLENWEKILKSFYFSSNPLHVTDLNLNGFDPSAPKVTEDALNYFIVTLYEEIKHDHFLSKLFEEKQHIYDTKQFFDTQSNKIINDDIYKFQLALNLKNIEQHKDYFESNFYDIEMENGENALASLCYSSTQDKQPILLLGDYGTGKTTICKKLSKELFENMSIYSFFIPLEKIKNEINGKKLSDLLLRSISDHGFSNNLNLYSFEKFTKENKVVIVLDGFDDLFWREKNENLIQNSVNDIISFSEICKLVLSSRSHFFQSIKKAELYFSNSFKILTLKAIGKNQIFEILENLGKPKLANILKSNDKLCDLASRPILLSMILNTPEELLSNNPRDETEVYSTYIEQWLERDRGKRLLFVKDEVKNTMVEVAHLCIERETSDIEEKDLYNAIKRNAEEKSASKNDLITEMITRSFLVHSSQEHCYQFSHRSFLEYFIALYVLKLIRKDELNSSLTKKLYYMEQVIWFLRGLMNESDTNLMITNIKNKEGKIRTFLIVICRHLIEQNEEFRVLLKEILFSEPYFEAASKVETIYAIYKYSSDDEKRKLSEMLINNENDYLLTAKAQYNTSEICLEWAKKRLSDPLFYTGREFLYFFPLSLIGDETDIVRIEPFTTNNNKLISEQAAFAINRLKKESSKGHVW